MSDPSEEESSEPAEFLCPCGLKLMEDPVSTYDGHTYERRIITEWFQKGHMTSPITNDVMLS